MRFVACAGVLAWCCGLSGCTLFNKKPGGEPAAKGGGIPPSVFPTGGNGPNPGAPGANNVSPASGVTSTANQGAILAGRVIDGYSRPPVNTSIRWVSLEDNKEAENEVSVTPEGYFTIQGLKPNGRYKLVARGKQGERLLAGVHYTTAPDIRVLIQVKEDFANSGTPAVPGPPVASPENNPNKTSGLGIKPINIPGNGSAPEHDLPVAINVTATPRSLNPAGPPAQNWTPGNEARPQIWPPTLELPRVKPAPPPLQIPIPAATPGPSNTPTFPANVSDALSKALIPSCVRVGDRIVNFALRDVNEQSWELRHRKGKLVLVDFWRTDCVPCLQSMPYLKELQTKFGALGLEVIGIANESQGLPQEQAYRVMGVCKRLGVNYRQLLSTGTDCPVRKEFGINVVPTLFLLDEQGFIIWREDGSPPPDKRAELERLIQRRLTTRAF